MGNSNIYINDYLSDNERFADLINGFLFRGKPFVHPKELNEWNTTIRKSEDETGNKPEETIRDQVKCWNHDGKRYILGVEAEQNIQYAMPVRIMNYDAGQYSHEYKKRKHTHHPKKDLPSHAYVAGITKNEELYPVFSMVLYLGDKPWDAYNQLSEVCGLQNRNSDLSDKLLPFFNDYHVHVLDVNILHNPDIFSTDLREVLGFLAYRKKPAKLRKFIMEHEGFRHLKPDAYKVIANLSNISELEIKKEHITKKGEINMCEAVETWLTNAREEGLLEGHQEGIREERFRNNVKRMLFQRLSQEKRYTELDRALVEDSYCEQLMLEYGFHAEPSI